MLGSSRTALAAVDEAVASAYEDPGLAGAGTDLLQVADLVLREKALRAALADSGRSAADRQAILGRLVGDRISPLALSLGQLVVAQRWSSDADMVDALEIAGASAIFGAAERAGRLDRVEEEIFRFGRIVSADGELQLTLSSTQVPAEVKRAVLSDLLAERADPACLELVTFAVTHLRGRRIDAALTDLVELAAVRRGQLSAVVTTASALTQEQQERLAAVLQRIYGRPVQLSQDIDPDVLGGLSVQVGDEVIDGTIANRLDQARRRLAG